MIYADASVLLATVLDEDMSAAVIMLLSDVQDLVASEWLPTEIASALGVKERNRQISARTRSIAFSACRLAIAEGATMLPVTCADCRRAAGYIQRTKLRAGDALHLAIAAESGATLWKLDRRMAEAGQALGLGARLLT